MNSLASQNRKEILEKISSSHYDLIIVGGGITGAGIALDAASRGLKTLLLEKNDFASGTSSRSTKLIHGGLRYLKQLHFREVAEVGRERKILFRNAPHLVYPEKMLLPFYEGGTFGKFTTSLALWVYDLLAGVKKSERRKMLSVEETLALEPLLAAGGLQGSGLYYEYRTDDWRLVFDVLKKAVSFGADCLNYCGVRGLTPSPSPKEKGARLTGVVAKDFFSGKTIELKGKYVVNATGPWTDTLTRLDNRGQKKMLHHTKGVHIVVARKDFPLKQSVYFDTGDGRMIFAIPRGEKNYIGTTDTDFNGDLENPQVTRADADYLLNAVNKTFSSVHLTKEKIVSGWAGIRPLIQQEGKAPSEISRKDEILISDHGLITIAGGKLTGFRKMAEKVVDIVMRKISDEKNSSFVKCKTENISLRGTGESLPSFSAKADSAGKADGGQGTVLQAVNEEGALTLSDYFIRRTGMLYFEQEKISIMLNEVADEMQKLLGWSEEEKERQMEEIQKEINVATNFTN